MENRKLNIGIIAVHAGAGYHSTLKEKDYKLLCSTACKKVMIKLKNGGSALDAVTLAIQCLEDSQMTNAGVGSSLTLEGTVECDASLMDGKSLLFGGVGALSNIKNPIMVAKKLLDCQKDGLLPLGRIPPCIMVGKGAHTWAKEHGIEPVSDVSLKSESSIKTYKNHKRRLDEAENRMERKIRKYLESKPRNDAISDTVGAVCIDMCGNIAAGASSGGISLKQSGRLGPAALYGTGCWAYNHRSGKKPGVAVATSGTGEHIIKTLLAKTCADLLQREDCPTTAMQRTLQDHFLDSDFLDQTTGRYGGVLALKHYIEDDKGQTEGKEYKQDHIVELLWGHTTDSMCIGYMSSSQSRPKTIISRQESEGKSGHTYLLQGHCFS